MKLKPVWKEFKRTIKEQIGAALDLSFGRSDQAWYAVEMDYLPEFPKVIALPLLLLRRQTELCLPEVLSEKIQFKDMLQETRQSLAKYAIDRSFNDEFNNARKDYRHFKIGKRYNPFIIADSIESDFYHLGARKAASRIDMVMLTVFSENISEKDKKKHHGERTAIDEWNKNVTNRSDDRRFTSEGWNLPEAELHAMSRQ